MHDLRVVQRASVPKAHSILGGLGVVVGVLLSTLPKQRIRHLSFGWLGGAIRQSTKVPCSVGEDCMGPGARFLLLVACSDLARVLAAPACPKLGDLVPPASVIRHFSKMVELKARFEIERWSRTFELI